jgi:threonine synthase
VDDQPEVRQLIRRILQSQGNYRLTEARDGRQGLFASTRKARFDYPGFDDARDGWLFSPGCLTSNPDTTHIPVIVVTAKELTVEKRHLNGHIQSLMQKGDFMSDELLREVQALLK